MTRATNPDLDRTPRGYRWQRVRSAQYDEIYVSPHMDDAVYSCGGQIALSRAAGARVLVVTVFGSGRGDEGAGRGVFHDMAQRKREERAAMERLDVDHVWLDFPELLVRAKSLAELARYALPFLPLKPSELHAQLFAALHVLCTHLQAPGGRIYVPLAIGFHPDHRIAFEVGRALQGANLPIAFYEDVPYVQVEALRRDRLRYLGLAQPSAASSLWRDAAALARFALAHAPRWQRALARGLLLAHLAGTHALFRVLGARGAGVRALDVAERDIERAVHQKVAAMRDYATQTGFFYPSDDALYDALGRASGRYLERYWTLAADDVPTFPRAEAYVARERENVAALLTMLPGQVVRA